MSNTPKYPVRTTSKSLELIESLKQRKTAGVTELAEDLDMGKSAVHNHLQTLHNHRFIVKEGDKYRLGLKFLEIGGYVRNRIGLYEASESVIKDLASETGRLVNLAVEEHGQAVFVYHEKGEGAHDFDLYTGRRKYLHNTAVGKAMLAHFPESRLQEFLTDHELPSETDKTITDPEELRAELKEIRERGYAIDNEESSNGIRCIAAPILDSDEVLGALSISGPASLMTEDEIGGIFADRVTSAANVIGLKLRFG